MSALEAIRYQIKKRVLSEMVDKEGVRRGAELQLYGCE